MRATALVFALFLSCARAPQPISPAVVEALRPQVALLRIGVAQFEDAAGLCELAGADPVAQRGILSRVHKMQEAIAAFDDTLDAGTSESDLLAGVDAMSREWAGLIDIADTICSGKGRGL